MHTNFSEWFRATNMELPGEVLQKRWSGVENFEVSRDEIISLAEVFFNFFDGKDVFLGAFRKAFQDADSSFRMRENNLELSVLAGATLVTVMEDILDPIVPHLWWHRDWDKCERLRRGLVEAFVKFRWPVIKLASCVKNDAFLQRVIESAKHVAGGKELISQKF